MLGICFYNYMRKDLCLNDTRRKRCEDMNVPIYFLIEVAEMAGVPIQPGPAYFLMIGTVSYWRPDPEPSYSVPIHL